jgi:hypothetical protein
MRLGLVALPLLLTLTACAHTPRTIMVPCIAKDQALPAEPEKVGPKLTGKADEDLRIVSGSALRLRAWGRSLQSVIEGCRG